MYQKVTLRSFHIGVAERLVLLANNPKVCANVRDNFPSPYTLADAYKWIEFCDNSLNTNLISRAIFYNDDFVGGIGVIRDDDIHRNNAEIGYWLGEPYWGLNIMTEAVKQMTFWVFKNTSVRRLYAGVFETNPASMRVLEKAGYHLECIHRQAVTKNGQTLDEYLYVMLA